MPLGGWDWRMLWRELKGGGEGETGSGGGRLTGGEAGEEAEGVVKGSGGAPQPRSTARWASSR